MNTHATSGRAVPVYSFRTLEDGWETSRISPFKATRDAIDTVFVGDVLECTVELVPADELDADGRWQRLPTGWRALS